MPRSEIMSAIFLLIESSSALKPIIWESRLDLAISTFAWVTVRLSNLTINYYLSMFSWDRFAISELTSAARYFMAMMVFSCSLLSLFFAENLEDRSSNLFFRLASSA